MFLHGGLEVGISIHALHEESECPFHPARTVLLRISIHALHEESDKTRGVFGRFFIFQSTLSMRRASHERYARHEHCISIHALHEESDASASGQSPHVHISIHALHEESDKTRGVFGRFFIFQSTLSMRRASHERYARHEHCISIHALHEESDSYGINGWRFPVFQSTLSMRRAIGCHTHFLTKNIISIHALHEESEPELDAFDRDMQFQSTLSMRRATIYLKR